MIAQHVLSVLARLADAARPEQPSLASALEAARVDDLRIVRELRAGLETDD